MDSPGKNGAKTILVVEDESNIVKLCCKALNGEGFEVDVAVNGRVAQEMVERKNYTICLIDILTPEMDGMEFFHWLGDRHPDMASRVIFTTGDMMRGKTAQFIEQSGMPFLPKPFTPGELQTVVSNALKI